MVKKLRNNIGRGAVHLYTIIRYTYIIYCQSKESYDDEERDFGSILVISSTKGFQDFAKSFGTLFLLERINYLAIVCGNTFE